ncbi:DUF2163 domain-containing protein [Bowmanella yangjiangensis]|uniref:DUF2163 domain-containing protein n=1 Tax=Bowmanella yangjiangensis TaxID=2811230 RepID=A0ABS3CYQ6_9ALTE|nr:DUF2163 domain-containing protein [Bowmanella yangjiangensis]MBN7822257.1 DUF2163 domain-containing protein [Bowmanella yangjiangensis]
MRRIPAALLAHLQQPVTTTCRLLKISLADGREFGMTTLDQAITYMGVEYSAINGIDSSIIATDTGLSVDNAEATALLSSDIAGITVEMALAGDLDDAQWEMMLINWADTSMGHMVIDAGDIGEVRVVDDMVYIPELLSFAMRLQQSIGHVWSRRCRAVFGTPANSQTGCGVDAESIWQSGTVTAVGSEPTRVFADSSLLLDTAPVPGRLRWLTGPNASNRLYQVEAYSNVSGTIALLEPVPFTIAPGHTFEIRRDCNKSPSDCIGYGNFINYKGEPLIPVGDGLETMTPSAQVFGGLSGSEIVD